MKVLDMIENLRRARDAGHLDPVTANTVIAILREHPELAQEQDEGITKSVI